MGGVSCETERRELYVDRIRHSQWFNSCTDLDFWHKGIMVLNPALSMDVYPVCYTVMPSTDAGLERGSVVNSFETCAPLIKPGKKDSNIEQEKKGTFRNDSVCFLIFCVLWIKSNTQYYVCSLNLFLHTTRSVNSVNAISKRGLCLQVIYRISKL